MDVENPCQNYIVIDQPRRNRGPSLPPVNNVDMARQDFVEKEGFNKFYGERRDLRPDKCVAQLPELRANPPPSVRHQQQCINPQYPVIMCDDLLAGRIRNSRMDGYIDRCKASDPLHVRYKRFCAPLGPQSTRECAIKCCGQLGAEPCVGFLCTPTGWLDKDSDYFRYAGLKKPPVKCQYPLPCKAHCYETQPHQNTWDPARQKAHHQNTWDPARQKAQCSPYVQPRTSTAQRGQPTSENNCCDQPTVNSTVPGEEHKQCGNSRPPRAIHATCPPGEVPKQQEHGYKEELLARDPQGTQQGDEARPVKFIRTHTAPPDLGATTSHLSTLSERQNYPADPQTPQHLQPQQYKYTISERPNYSADPQSPQLLQPQQYMYTISDRQNNPADLQTPQLLQPQQYKYTIKRPMDGRSGEAMEGLRQYSMRKQYT